MERPSVMQQTKQPRAMTIIGWVLSGIPAAMLLLGGIMDLVKPPFVVDGMTAMGYPADVLTGLGIVLLLAAMLYLIPRTAFLGAIVLTGYLGGAVATHVRAGDPLLTRGLIPVYFATALWLGLCLRDGRLRSALSLRGPDVVRM